MDGIEFHTYSKTHIFYSVLACEPPNILCRANGHQTCISSEFICDDTWECEDGEDEKHCVHDGTDKHCYGEQWECQDHKECIDKAKVCDGKNDCPDGSDEMQLECGKFTIISYES